MKGNETKVKAEAEESNNGWTTTGEDANPNSRRMRQSGPVDDVQPVNGISPGDAKANSAAEKMASGGCLTVEKYILQLRLKDDKIRSLEEENAKLRSNLLTKSGESQARVDELVKELERHADLVAKLQSELAQHRNAPALANNNSRRSLVVKKARRAPIRPPAATATATATAVRLPSSLKARPAQCQQNQNQLLSTNAADEICAKLQSFVERNNQQQQAAPSEMPGNGTNQQEEDEMLTEQLFKMMAEDPSIFPALLLGTTAGSAGEGAEAGGGLSMDGNEASSLLNMLLDSSSAATESHQIPTEEAPEQQQQVGDQCSKTTPGQPGSGGVAAGQTAQQSQQNLDFEEVMQRVIGEAMSGTSNNNVTSTNNGTPSAAPASARGRGKSSFGTSTITGGGKGGGKQQKAAPLTNTLGCSPAGTPLALPTKSGANVVVKKEAKHNISSIGSAPSQVPLSQPHHTPSSASAKPFTPEEQKLVNELEARIDQNIVDLGLCPLNTSELAIQCTRLMREYSIGQRLFARTVMCKVSQSQGSLSELLSKPRPWHKLTDKGRDAFRRIFGWISDDTAIELLCQLSPRKVTLTEKIVHPEPTALLESLDGPEASAMLEFSLGSGKKNLKQLNSSASSTHSSSVKSMKSPKTELIAEQPLATKQQISQKDATATPSSGRWRHDDIPREKIINIYEAEKAKLMEQETSLGRTMGLMPSNSSSRVGSLSPSRGGTATATGLLTNKVGRSPSTHSSTMGSSDQQDNNFVPLLFGTSQQQRGTSLTNNCNNTSTRLLEQPFPIAQSQIERYTLLDTEEVVRQVKEFLAKNAISQRQFGESVLGLSQGSVSDLLARPKSWQSLTPKGREPFVRMHIFLEQYSRTQMAKEEEPMEEGKQFEVKCEQPEEKEEEDDQDNGEGELELKLPLDSSTEEQSEQAEEEQRSEFDDLTANDAGEDSDKILQQILAHIKTEQQSEQKTPANQKAAEAKPLKMKTESGQQQKAQQQHRSNSNAASSDMAMNGGGGGGAQGEVNNLVDELDTADVARRVRESLSKNGISQRAFGEHVLKMTSGCVSDLLAKPKLWIMLGWKQRQSYLKMLDFLTDPGAVDRLRIDEQHRCEMNSALNAIKAMAATTAAASQLTDNCTNLTGLNSPAGLAAEYASKSSPSAAANLVLSRGSPSSTLQIVTSLATELGVNTPIGTILKKANSPKPTTGTNSRGQQNGIKRKLPSSNGMAASLLIMEAAGNELLAGGQQPLRKIPRFQRTLITEKQKEALLFVFAHEQRPNSRCIEQLALKLGLTQRTVTNWFHNYRTRQKTKEIKTDADELALFSQGSQSSASLISTPTPAQVLARALNASDLKTANWFKELAELLRRHSDANINIDSIGNSGSVGTISAESSPTSPQHRSALGMDNEEDSVEEEEEEGGVFGHQVEGRAQSSGASSSASPSPLHQHQNGGRQLDRVIARMHSRLAATSVVQ